MNMLVCEVAHVGMSGCAHVHVLRFCRSGRKDVADQTKRSHRANTDCCGTSAVRAATPGAAGRKAVVAYWKRCGRPGAGAFSFAGAISRLAIGVVGRVAWNSVGFLSVIGAHDASWVVSRAPYPHKNKKGTRIRRQECESLRCKPYMKRHMPGMSTDFGVFRERLAHACRARNMKQPPILGYLHNR